MKRKGTLVELRRIRAERRRDRDISKSNKSSRRKKKDIGMRKERLESRRRQDGPEDGEQEITFSRPEELPKSRGKPSVGANFPVQMQSRERERGAKRY